MKPPILRLFFRSKLSGLKNGRNFSTGPVLNKLRISYTNSVCDEPLVGWTIGNVVDRSATLYGDREAVIFCHQNVRKNFHQLKDDVEKLATGFIAIGLDKGDRIGIWSTNKYEWILTQLAAAKAGLITVSINAAYQEKELEYVLNKVQIKAIVFDDVFKNQNYYKILKSLIPNLSESKTVMSEKIPSLKYAISLSPEHLSGSYKFDEVLNSGGTKEKELFEDLQTRIQFDDPVKILFTSGTTGNPKGATLSHHNVVNNAYILGKVFGFYTKHHRVCLPLPLFHIFGCSTGFLNCFISGSTAVFPSRTFDATEVAKAIHKERVTCIMGTPTMFIDIIHLPNFNQYDFTSLQTAFIGGAGCPEALLDDIIEKMHAKFSIVGYGTTELSPTTISHSPTAPLISRKTTVGPLLPHLEMKLINENKQVVPIDTQGELCVRGYAVMLGYWGDPEKTKAAITPDRWYKTGDLATVDENGLIKIVGRIKDMIIRGGENIYPKEIEDFLHTHNKIAEVQVVGVPDQRMGEEVCAWIKTTKKEKLSEEDIKIFCKGNMASFKIPRYVMFVDEFPKTSSGKIQKFKMREESIKMLKLST